MRGNQEQRVAVVGMFVLLDCGEKTKMEEENRTDHARKRRTNERSMVVTNELGTCPA